MESQLELEERIKNGNYFDEMYPIWQCPECGNLNRFVATFGEICMKCGNDFTLTWESYKRSA